MNLYLQKIAVFLAFIFSLSYTATGQLKDGELSTKSKKAIAAYGKGIEFYTRDIHAEAEVQFLKAVEEDPRFFEAWMMLGDLYESSENMEKALSVYEKAVAIDSFKYKPVYNILGDLYFGRMNYGKARDCYQLYLKHFSPEKKKIAAVEKQLRNCEFAIGAVKDPVPFTPVNMGENINSIHHEYFPCLTADKMLLLFTRLIPDNRSNTGRQEEFFVSRSGGGNWEPSTAIGEPINSPYNEGAPSLSADGKTLIFTACESMSGYSFNREGYGSCDLFITQRSGNNWSIPENLGEPVNSENWESQPSLSSDGKTLYFISNREGGYNIWKSIRDDKGNWAVPVKLESHINTAGTENSVFIHPDNQTLYFSSDGHPGMGGLDIFYSRIDSAGNWGRPVNLGYPINTVKDENSIMISADGRLAFFASDRPDGFGGMDLYQFELYESARPVAVNYMKGTVYDEETGSKLKARFELIDLSTGQTAVTSFSDQGTGEFLVCLPTNRDYALNVAKDGYLFYSENFSMALAGSIDNPFLKDIPMKRIKTGESIVLKNIFFETGKYELKPESAIELGKLIDFLRNNSNIKIEISGHTDNVGEDILNQVLSENRAKAVYDYLISGGISQDKLDFKGYGESKPCDTNDNEEGRANNRRTEFRILSN